MSGLISGILGTPKIKTPTVKPPPTPALSDSLVFGDTIKAYSSMISTSPAGLKRKASTEKRTLLGG
jgi:hypothetical protein